MGQYPSSPAYGASQAVSSCPAQSVTTASSLSCPAVPLTTRYETYTSVIVENTATSTSFVTIAQSTVTETISVDQTFTSYFANTTATSTYTAPARTVYTQLSAECTVTIATPSGFTPIRCEATYQQPTPPTVTLSTAVRLTGDLVVESTITEPVTLTVTDTQYTGIVTETTSYDVSSVLFLTPYTTVTISSATTTAYEACGTQNVVITHPRGNGFLFGARARPPAVQANVVAADATQCCGICQGNSTCFASAYLLGFTLPCRLFLLDPAGSQKCDPTAAYGILEIDNYAGELPFLYVSNSGCGQLRFLQ